MRVPSTFRRAAAAVAAALAAATPAAAQVGTIGTGAAAGFVAAGRVAGDPTTFVTLAQSFVAPAAGCGVTTCYLQDFTLFLGDGFRGADTRWRAYVYAFGNDLALTGPALWRSAEFAGSGNAFALDPFRFEPFNLALLRGGQYAFVLSAAEPLGRLPAGATVLAGATLADGYDGGALFGSTAATLSALGTPGAFARVSGAPDLAFRATFTNFVIPEPGTAALVGAGLLVAGSYGWRQRRGRQGQDRMNRMRARKDRMRA